MDQPLKPLTLGELLDRTFVVYRRHFLMFTGVIAVPAVVQLTLQLSAISAAQKGSGASALFSLTAVIVAAILAALAYGALIVAVSQTHLGETVTVRQGFLRARERFWEIVLVSMNVGIRILFGLVLLIVPGIWLALKYALALQVAVLEDSGVSESLTRSSDLTVGGRGRVFVIGVLLIVLYFTASMLIQVPAVLLASVGSHGELLRVTMFRSQVASAAASFLVQILLGPLYPIALTLLYYDERVKKEGFDLVRLLERVDRSEPVAAPTA